MVWRLWVSLYFCSFHSRIIYYIFQFKDPWKFDMKSLIVFTVCVGSHSASPARWCSSLPDLPASLPLTFCYYVITEAIADRKYSYTPYTHLEDKFWLVEMWNLAWDTGTTVTRAHSHTHTHTHNQTHLRKHNTHCINLTNHLSPFIKSDRLFARTALMDANTLNWEDYSVSVNIQERSCRTNLFLRCDLSTVV